MLCLFVLVLLGPSPAPALDSQAVFERNEKAVFQIKVINRATGKKTSIGSGFIYGSPRHLATNYHVVSHYIERPDEYELRYVGNGGDSGRLHLNAVDAVHDLALVSADISLGEPLPIDEPPAKGAALFAMGNPLDLGLTLAAGTNGGVLGQTDGSRILFSGSLNPGMSGGPTFDGNGAVVGVNVATARNDISFIVPTRYLKQLNPQQQLDIDTLRDAIATQIRDHQVRYINTMLETRWPLTQIRDVQVPGAISPTIRCWDSSPKPKPERLYKQLNINCENENEIFLTDKIDVGKVLYEFVWLKATDMAPLRFNRLYATLNNSQFGSRAGKKDVTRFACQTEFVETGGGVLKTTTCRRHYKRYPGLSDILFTAILVNRPGNGFIFNLDLSGTDSATANTLVTRFLRQLKWQH